MHNITFHILYRDMGKKSCKMGRVYSTARGNGEERPYERVADRQVNTMRAKMADQDSFLGQEVAVW